MVIKSLCLRIVFGLCYIAALAACGGGGGSDGGGSGGGTNANTQDVTPPVIALLGTNPTNLLIGSAFTEPGATASDDVDGNISSRISIAGNTVNSAVAGTYLITYDVADAAGNAAIQVTRAVIVSFTDFNAPVISLLGNNPLNLQVGAVFIDPGVSAIDDIDGNITGQVSVAGDTVDTATAGSYTISYNVVDAAGNAAVQITRTVIVTNAPPAGGNVAPVISNFSVNNTPTFTHAPVTFSWAVSDADGNVLTCFLDVDNNGTIEYTISDCANTNSQTHVYSVAGDFTARLTISDGIALPVERTLTITSLLPLSTEVSVSGPAVAGTRLLYTITVANLSPIPVDDVSVLLRIPAALSFAKSTNADPDASGCIGSFCDPGEEARWSLGRLAAGDSRSITVDAFVDTDVLSGAIITAPVTFSATGVSNIQINKTLEVSNDLSADLTLNASADPVTANQSYTYFLDFGNVRSGSLTTLQLRASLPADVTVVAISDGGTQVSPGEVVWNVTSLGVGASLHREITVVANATLAAGTILQASAQLGYDGGLPVDNTAEHAVTAIATAAQLKLDISTSQNPVIAGERVLYALTVSNVSLLPVFDVRVVMHVPAELSFAKSTNAEPDASGCIGSFCDPGEIASWSLGTLAAGGSRTITVAALVADGPGVLSGNLISTSVRVTATSLGDDINMRKTIAVFNAPSTDMVVSASADPVATNQSYTYQLDAGNISALPLTTVQLSASLPQGVTVSSISDGGTENSPGEVVWNVAVMGIGVLLQREITVIADGVSAGDILTLNARLTHDNGLALDNTAKNVVTAIASAAPLTVDISSSQNPAAAGGRVLYTLTVSNTSFLPMFDVDVVMHVPAELSFAKSTNAEPDASGCIGSFCDPGEIASWSLGELAVGENRSIIIDALVISPLLNGNLISTAFRVTATALGDDINIQKTIAIQN